MAKCEVSECAKWVSGGLEEVILINEFSESQSAKRPPVRIFWCDDHEQLYSANPNNWRFLTETELRRL